VGHYKVSSLLSSIRRKALQFSSSVSSKLHKIAQTSMAACFTVYVIMSYLAVFWLSVLEENTNQRHVFLAPLCFSQMLVEAKDKTESK